MDAVPPVHIAPRPVLPNRTPGADRRVGVEIEFLGLSARAAAMALARHYGSVAEAEDPHAWRIQGTRLGDIAVEMDLRHVHPRRRADLMVKPGAQAAALLGRLLSPVVPRELIVAPVAAACLPEIDAAVSILRAAGARGCGVVLLDSLGLHFNIEVPAADAATVASTLKAFLILEPRLRREIAQGSLRRHLALPPHYPAAYRRRVLDPAYWPAVPALMTDYLAANPSRKRGLDLLPLFAHLDEDRVRAVLPREKISPRPVFHYRLPQACPGVPGWSVMPDWERWLAVEALVANQAELLAWSRISRG
ncbi:MAG: amidoligase family protein [Rhodopila sp.]